ncbi:MAG: hypothetical protein LBT23_02185 [Synergistaceae bacterium]|nr:hypothetical protein [Synergistaceae bacterium]
MNNDRIVLDLTTFDGLNDEVRRLLAALSGSMVNEDDKASIGITIGLKRVRDTETMLEISYKVKPTFPSKARQILAHSDLYGNLKVDATPAQMNLFPIQKITGQVDKETTVNE